jgi:predicted lysophospholipase L1 biosynthesis ABC-type transport system permease subunit
MDSMKKFLSLLALCAIAIAHATIAQTPIGSVNEYIDDNTVW